MPGDFNPQTTFTCFMVGMLVCSLAAFGTSSGKVWVKNQGWVYRAKEPKSFWFWVALYSLFGVGLIGYSFYRVS